MLTSLLLVDRHGFIDEKTHFIILQLHPDIQNPQNPITFKYEILNPDLDHTSYFFPDYWKMKLSTRFHSNFSSML